MLIDYEVDGVAKTLTAQGLPLEAALSLLPDHATLEGVQYA